MMYRITISNLVVRFLLITLVFAVSFPYLFAETQTVIKSVYIGQHKIPKFEWENIEINTQDTIAVTFDDTIYHPDSSHIFYKVYLNGNIKESHNMLEKLNEVVLSGLNAGNYILKIQVYSSYGWESAPALIQFQVVESNPLSASENIPLLYYIFIGLIVIQFAVILLLWKKSKKAADTTNYVKRDAYLKVSKSYEKLLKDFEQLNTASVSQNLKIDDLQQNIHDLEVSNENLLQQKEKLLKNQRNLEELQRQKDELIAMTAHDIKNPAAAIKSSIELLNSYSLNAMEQQEIMKSLLETSSAILNLTNEMVKAVAEKTIERKMDFELANIKTIVDSVISINNAYATRKNVTLIKEKSDIVPDTMMDITKIGEAIDNLVNNAIKYAPKNTVVKIRTILFDASIVVEVSDNGLGLSQEDMQHTFEKGVMLQTKPTGGESRSGLGLWIVKKIIDAHGGKVFVKSKLGQGTTFSFELPIKDSVQ